VEDIDIRSRARGTWVLLEVQVIAAEGEEDRRDVM